MSDISSLGKGNKRGGWTTEAKTSMGWKEHKMANYAVFNRIRKKMGPRYYAHCDFKRSGKLFNAVPLFIENKGFGPTDLHYLYDAKILGGGENSQNLMYHLENCHKFFFTFATVCNSSNKLKK